MSTEQSSWGRLQTGRTCMGNYGSTEYRYFLGDWVQLLDVVHGGEREVKEKGQEYLPKTSGQRENTEYGQEVYDAYKTRSVFYGYSKDTLLAMVGVMHAKIAKFEVPDTIAELNKESEDPTAWRVGLQQMLREINENQLCYGRYGLLVDMPAGETPTQEAVPKILPYECFAILSWGTRTNEKGDIVLDNLVLAERASSDDREIAEDNCDMQIRVLGLNASGEYFSVVRKVEEDGDSSELDEINLDNPPTDAVYPIANDKPLEFIPFVFINVTHLLPEIEKSPILQLCNMDVSIYRGDADWAQAYFLQGQATPVVTGVNDTKDKLLLGAGGSLLITNENAKAYYMEVEGNGLGEMRQRQMGLQKFAASMGVALIDNKQPESGVALETRVGIKSAPLDAVAKTGARGLTQALRYANFWKTGDMGLKDIVVEPNTDFSTATKAARDLVDLWTAKLGGAPISMRDIHQWARDNNFTRKDFEETLEDLGEE